MRVEPPDRTMPRGADITKAISAPSAATEIVEIDAAKYPIKTVYLSGTANWTGIYGLSGKFEGWFSDDEARIPIRAKMKLYVGDANIELVKWSRGSWQPPKSE